MSTGFKNSSITSNINKNRVLHDENIGESIEIQFPVKLIKSVDLSNKPHTSINGYTANRKTMVQSMFNERNLNENLNFKNTFYLEERGDAANKESHTIYDHAVVYPKHVVDSELKAQYAAKTWKERHINSEKKVRNGLQKTTNKVTQNREEDAKIHDEEAAKHEKEVRKYFKKVQNLVGVMVGAIPAGSSQEKFHLPSSDETDRINIQHIQKEANDEGTILNNRANIRSLMGVRSLENQEKIQAEKDARDKVAAAEEAQRKRIEKQEEAKISKYMNLDKLSQTWRIFDRNQLKGVVRNEIMKEVMKEEERKNFEKIAQNMRKKEESPKKSLIKKDVKPKIEPPKAYSPKKNKKKNDKKYVFSPENIRKLPSESPDDYKTRFNFTVMALPKQKEALDPVEQHKITKQFQEMMVKNTVEKNGKIVLESNK